MMGDELHKFGLCRPEGNSDFSAMGLGGSANPGSRQIYLTFPADSTFKEEDQLWAGAGCEDSLSAEENVWICNFRVSRTVKLIQAKGNAHFVCDSRVLVNPYKEKGKVPEKKQQQIERGARMLYNTQEKLLRRKPEEQDELQQAIKLNGRRLMNLQLLDLKQNNHVHHYPNRNHNQFPHDLSKGSPIPSPTQPQTPHNQALLIPIAGPEEELQRERYRSPVEDSQNAAHPDDDQEVNNPSCDHNNGNANSSSARNTDNKLESSSNNSTEENDLHERNFVSII